MSRKKRGNGNGAVVKIDSSLMEKVERFIQQGENRLKFANKKHLIDIAVSEFLKKEAAVEK